MANDKKDSAFWFKHDYNAQDDPKCMLLIDQLGMEGYGIFWALLEKLRVEAEHRLSLKILNSFARRWATSNEKICAVIKNYDLFTVDGDFFYSKRLINDMITKSEKARLSASYRWNNANGMRTHANALQSDSERNANGMRNDANKKRREKKRKEGGMGGMIGLPEGNRSNTGSYFDLRPEIRIVRLQDGKEQKLGPEQFDLAVKGQLHPEDVTEGDIY